MKTSEALEICPDFLPRQQSDGTYKCVHFVKHSECCVLPSHFVCELVLHKRKEARLALPTAADIVPEAVDIDIVQHKKVPLAIAAGGPPVSVSRIAVLEKCPRLYELTYHYRLPSPVAMRWKIVGRAYGEARAAIDLRQPWENVVDRYREDLSGPERARMRAVLRHYELQMRGDIVNCEKKVEFEYRDVKFIGYTDAETKDGRIYEWKYAAGEYDLFKLARQAAVYLKGRPDAKEFVGAVAKKPQHSLKKLKDRQETAEELEERIFQAIEDPFTYTAPITREHIDVDTVLDQMLASWSTRKELARLGYPPHYGMHCDDCEYRNLCANHVDRAIGCDREICATASMCTHIRKFLPTPAAQPSPKELPSGINLQD